MLHHLRKSYQFAALTEKDAAIDPFVQLDNWLKDALKSDEQEPTAMVVSTIDADLQPHARVVLLKDFSPDGLVFFTNYLGNKGKQLELYPKASILFFWQSLERQVRITGTVEKTSQEVSDTYFHSRPIESRLGAWVSEQSSVIPSPAYLSDRFETFQQQFGETVPRPPHWGGYLVRPLTFEFWQGRPSRLHDRLFYSKVENGEWEMVRLAP